MMVATSPEDAIKHLGELLATAINSGDKENAEKYAGNLALSGVRVAITVDTSNIQNKDLEFSIKVFVEDREASGGCISLKVKATDTVMDLKNKMFMKHSFPVEVQKWVIGKRMPQDTETLQKARVTPGQSLYLYLVTAKSVGLKREDVMARKAQMPYHQAQPASFGNQNFNESGDYMMMLPRTPVTPQSGNFQQRSQPSPVIKQAVAQPQPYPHPPHPKDNRGQVHVAPQAEVKTLPARTKDTHQSFEMIDMPTDLGAETNKMAAAAAGETNEIGWTCPDCTYLNKPTWPGCEICTKDRPASYKIPDGYEMTKEEKERLKREQESEQHAKKASDVRRPREITNEEIIANLGEHELDQLLRFNDTLQETFQRKDQGNPPKGDKNLGQVSLPFGPQPTIPVENPGLQPHPPMQNIPDEGTVGQNQGLDQLQFHMEPRNIRFNESDDENIL